MNDHAYTVCVRFAIDDYDRLSRLITVLADMIAEGDGHNVKAYIDPHPRGPSFMAFQDLDDAIAEVNRTYNPPEMEAYITKVSEAVRSLSNILGRISEDYAIINRRCSDPREDATPSTCSGCMNVRPSPDGSGYMCNLSRKALEPFVNEV